MDTDNTTKDALKFDIEFMCRCLGLALMRHLEQGKEKQHITDLDTPEKAFKFSFMNIDFNNNIHLLKDFFNTNAGGKLLGDLKMVSVLEKYYMENEGVDDNDIDMMKHLKKNGDEKIIQKDDIQEESSKLKSGLSDIDNEIKFIKEYFSYPKKKVKNYQDVSEMTKKILCKDLSFIKEIDSELNKTGNSNTINNNSQYISKSINNSKINKVDNNSEINISKADSKNNEENKNKIIDEEEKDEESNYEDEFLNNDNAKKEEEKAQNKIEDKNKENTETEEKEKKEGENIIKDEIKMNNNLNENILAKKLENIKENSDNGIEADIETDYIIDVDNIAHYKAYLLKKFEVFDDDFLYYTMNVPVKKFMPPPDPQSIFEFCANIMILTKMEKEVIIISLIYIERLIFNTGFILNSRNWRKIAFIALVIASKIWDDDSLENIHYSQVFTHLKVGEINLIERTFLELINYKIFVKFSEYMKYYFAIKNLALKYNFNGEKIIPVSVEKTMKIHEYANQMQKRMRRKTSLNNSAHF
jgi:hypothetical protein